MNSDSHHFYHLFHSCRLCPRECSVNRLGEGRENASGYCRSDYRLRVAYIGPHFGEEPPLTGIRGSGTVFFSGCSLRCSFCQNYQISRDGLGEELGMDQLLERVETMILLKQVHNVNLVSPDHFFPHVFQMVAALRRKGYEIPIIYNLSGYQSIALLKMAEDFSDIYLPDFKYADPGISSELSRCKDYPEIALSAISEMLRQKGFLDSVESGNSPAKRGVLVRHMILPGYLENSLNALTTLFLEFGPGLPLSLMSQYTPVLSHKYPPLNRSLSKEEFEQIYSHAVDLGFEHLYVQFYEENPLKPSQKEASFLPDFRRKEPFCKL